MAIYHLSLKMVQRSKGQSVVAVAADRARVLLHDRRLGQSFSPLPAKRSTRPILSEILLPKGVPERWRSREALWNEVEGQERRHDSSLAREVEFALPAELSPEQASALARGYVLAAFVAAGMVADLNVHWPPPADGQLKPYAQALLTLRRVSLNGFELKEPAWNDRVNAKIGPNAARRARRGEPSERVQEHRAIAQRNRERATESDSA